MNEAFWTIHTDLPREGPGRAEDVAWAAALAHVPPEARICDAGAGPGADIPALLQAAPRGHVTAVERHADFVERIVDAFPSDRVDARQSDMFAITGPYEFVWSAGAIYFLGVKEALTAWRGALGDGGAIAFSAPGYFVDQPSSGAIAFWQGFDGVLSEQALRDEVASAGFEVLGLIRLSEESWEAYFGPLEARCADLKPGADATLAEAIADHEAEIAAWRAHKEETGYFLCVVTPV